MQFHHRYGIFSYALKFLSICALCTILSYLWSYHAYYGFYYVMNHGNPIGIFLDIDWKIVIFCCVVFVAGIFDRPRTLYLYPVIAYFILINGICFFIASNHKIAYEIHLPGVLYTFSYCFTLVCGLITLYFWDRRQLRINPPAPLSKHVKDNLIIIYFLTCIVLTLDTLIFMERLPYYLEKYNGVYSLAVNSAGLDDLIVWVILLISSLRRSPRFLWLCACIAITYLYPYFDILVDNPYPMTLTQHLLGLFAATLVIFGSHTFICWLNDEATLATRKL